MIGIGGMLQGVMVSIDGSNERGGEEKRDMELLSFVFSLRKYVVQYTSYIVQ
jgi:hypothetical protein